MHQHACDKNPFPNLSIIFWTFFRSLRRYIVLRRICMGAMSPIVGNYLGYLILLRCPVLYDVLLSSCIWCFFSFWLFPFFCYSCVSLWFLCWYSFFSPCLYVFFFFLFFSSLFFLLLLLIIILFLFRVVPVLGKATSMIRWKSKRILVWRLDLRSLAVSSRVKVPTRKRGQ